MLDVSRQVLPLTQVLLTEQGRLGAVALANRGADVHSTKVEWKEMTMGAIKVKLTSQAISGYFSESEAKAIELDTTNLMVGDILSVQDENRKSKWNLRIMITEIVSGTEAKAQKVGWKDVAIETSDFLFVETTAKEEGAIAKKRRPFQTPRTLYNYTQIIKGDGIITGTQAQVNNYDFDNIKKEIRKQAYKKYAEDLDGIVTSGVRRVIETSRGTQRVAGGLLYFAGNSFNKSTGEQEGEVTENIIEVNGELTVDHVHQAFKNVIDNGGSLNSVVVNTAQAIAISKLYEDKVNVNVINGTVPSTVGGAVQILKSPINVSWNNIENIYLDTKMPQDEIIFFNKNIIKARAMAGRAALEQIHMPTADNDNYICDILGEWTVTFENARENTFVLTKMSV